MLKNNKDPTYYGNISISSSFYLKLIQVVICIANTIEVPNPGTALIASISYFYSKSRFPQTKKWKNIGKTNPIIKNKRFIFKTNINTSMPAYGIIRKHIIGYHYFRFITPLLCFIN